MPKETLEKPIEEQPKAAPSKEQLYHVNINGVSIPVMASSVEDAIAKAQKE